MFPRPISFFTSLWPFFVDDCLFPCLPPWVFSVSITRDQVYELGYLSVGYFIFLSLDYISSKDRVLCTCDMCVGACIYSHTLLVRRHYLVSSGPALSEAYNFWTHTLLWHSYHVSFVITMRSLVNPRHNIKLKYLPIPLRTLSQEFYFRLFCILTFSHSFPRSEIPDEKKEAEWQRAWGNQQRLCLAPVWPCLSNLVSNLASLCLCSFHEHKQLDHIWSQIHSQGFSLKWDIWASIL